MGTTRSTPLAGSTSTLTKSTTTFFGLISSAINGVWWITTETSRGCAWVRTPAGGRSPPPPNSLLTCSLGHTATLYQGDKLLVFGGENEHRTYLSDLIIFDLKTAHWTQPQVTGPIPKGRARHSALLHEDKLFIIGGITGHDNYVLDDICYIDLKTFTWSRAWRFVGRFDHSAYIWLVRYLVNPSGNVGTDIS